LAPISGGYPKDTSLTPTDPQCDESTFKGYDPAGRKVPIRMGRQDLG
jgi:hypothetical protein